MGNKGITRRDALKLGGLTLAGVAGGAMLGGCGSNSQASTQASSQKDPRANVPADATGNQISKAGSVAEPVNIDIQIDDPGVPIRYDIVDCHLHYSDFLEKTDGFPALVKAQDMSGVSESVIFGMGIAKQWDEDTEEAPSYYLSNDSRCYYYSATDFLLAEDLLAQPDNIRKRFHPFLCGINGNDRFAADHIRQLLKVYPNFWEGIGEIMSRHDDLTALTYGEPPHIDHPAFLDVFDLGAEQGLPVMIHHNITAQNTEKVLYLDELRRAAAHNRDCKIIWAHVGISRRVEIQHLPEIAAEMLATNPNLYTDISWVVYDYYIKDDFPSRYKDNDSMDDWVRLIEEYPDRIMVGTDKVGHWKTYPSEVVKYYDLLDKLKPETAKKICRENILGLVKKY